MGSLNNNISYMIAFIVIIGSITPNGAVTTKKSAKLDTLIDDYSESGDIEEFCEDLEQEFHLECQADLNNQIREKFRQLVNKGNKRDISLYLNTRIISHDDELEMTERECNKLYRKAKHMSSKKFLEYLAEELDERGYVLTSKMKRSGKLKNKIDEMVELDSCNLGSIANIFGSYESPTINPKYFFRALKSRASNLIYGHDCDDWECYMRI